MIENVRCFIGLFIKEAAIILHYFPRHSKQYANFMQDWPQNTLPVIGTMNIPIVKEGLHEIPKLIEAEQPSLGVRP